MIDLLVTSVRCPACMASTLRAYGRLDPHRTPAGLRCQASDRTEAEAVRLRVADVQSATLADAGTGA